MNSKIDLKAMKEELTKSMQSLQSTESLLLKKQRKSVTTRALMYIKW